MICAGGRARSKAQRDERKRNRAGVGEHVGGVREQGQRVREDPGDDLAGHEDDDQNERDREAALVRVGADVHVCVCAVRRAALVVHDVSAARWIFPI